MSMDVPDGLNRAASEPQSNQMRFVLDVVSRHWTIIMSVVLLSGVVGTGIGYVLQEDRYEYSATATLVVKPSIYAAAMGTHVGTIPARELVEMTSTRSLSQDIARALVQQDIAQSKPLGAITSSEEYEATAAQIEPLLTLYDDVESNAVVITVQSDSLEAAEQMADTAARILLDQADQYFREEQELTHNAVEIELASWRKQLDEAESDEWLFHEKMGYRTPEQLRREIEEKTGELRESTFTHKELTSSIEEVNKALRENRGAIPADLEKVSEAAVERLKEELDELIGDKAELKVVYRSDSPFLTPLSALDEDIKFKADAVMIAINELGGEDGLAGGAWDRQKTLYTQKVNFEAALANLKIRSKTLEKVIDQLQTDHAQLGDKRFDYARLVHETNQVRTRFNQMLEREFEIETAKNRGLATLTRRDGVVTGTTYSGAGSPIWVTGLMGAAIGFIIAFAFAMMIEVMDTSVRTPEDVNQFFNLEVLGLIPMMHFGKQKVRSRRRKARAAAMDEDEVDACLVTKIDPKSPVSEAYRSFRTNYQFATLQAKPKTVMMTSSVPGEGKTTTAVNFAVTMADQGMRVLLVDTDLRRPNVHRVLRMERGPGLADVLRENVPVKEVIRPTRVENLWIISSGRVPPNPSELIGSDRMKQLLRGLGESFDLVVCDAPSILVVTDPVLLASYVDSVALVIAVNNARRETVGRAIKLLETAAPSVAGVVLNGLEATRKHYYYYYYYDDASPGRRRWFHSF